MKERPILFSGPMVREILAGRKTQTRRVLTVPWKGRARCQPYDPYFTDTDGRLFWEDEYGDWNDYEKTKRCPYGIPGDRLWVKETWLLVDDMNGNRQIHYQADNEDIPGPWKPSIFMPRWASRITLEITNVRVERLQGITEEDAIQEGCGAKHNFGDGSAKTGFAMLWDSINGKKYPWESNPWVWCIEFKRVLCPNPSASEK